MTNIDETEKAEALAFIAIAGAAILFGGEIGAKVVKGVVAAKFNKCSTCHLKLEFPDVEKKS